MLQAILMMPPFIFHVLMFHVKHGFIFSISSNYVIVRQNLFFEGFFFYHVAVLLDAVILKPE